MYNGGVTKAKFKIKNIYVLSNLLFYVLIWCGGALEQVQATHIDYICAKFSN
jgi:hypothetical protein